MAKVQPVMFKGVHVQEFRATFSMMRRGYATGSTNDHSAYFIFNATKAYDLTEHEDDFASTSVGDFARSRDGARIDFRGLVMGT